jgi:hypothetical protein
MELIYQKYQEKCSTVSDINEHLPTLKKYAEECDSIVEMGMRAIVSTWAFLAANPKKLISLDLSHPSTFGGDLQEVINLSLENSIEFEFVQKNSLEYDMPIVDLLFIDTWHDYLQLKMEIFRHHSKVGKYIILHDTTTYGFKNEGFYHEYETPRPETNLPKGLNPAVDEFLFANKEWKLWEKKTNNNGLTILKKTINL